MKKAVFTITLFLILIMFSLSVTATENKFEDKGKYFSFYGPINKYFKIEIQLIKELPIGGKLIKMDSSRIDEHYVAVYTGNKENIVNLSIESDNMLFKHEIDNKKNVDIVLLHDIGYMVILKSLKLEITNDYWIKIVDPGTLEVISLESQ